MRARRREVVDEYVEDGRAAIYTDQGMVVLLSELATSAWVLLGDHWISSSDVAEHLVLAHGDPGDGSATRLTEVALALLSERSLVDLETDADPE